MTTPDVFDMDTARVERARTRAARREGRGDTLVIRFGGQDIAELGAEFPLDVLEPFSDINLDLALLIRQAIDLMNAEDQGSQFATIDMIVSVLAANPKLPTEVIAAVKEAGRRLLSEDGEDRQDGEDGYAKFVERRPTPWDVAALVRHLMNWYGVTLGDFSSPSTPSVDGGTSKPISNATTTVSTPAGPGGAQVTPASSASAASPL